MTDLRSKWGASYRLVAADNWKSKSAAMGRNVTEELIRYARPAPGMKVLDVATGTGEPAISLCSRVGAQGRVAALDLSFELLAIASRRAQQRRLANFFACQADAQALPFPGECFDLVTSRFGIMFFADAEKALGEIARVLKSGSRVCVAAWGRFEQPYWASTMGVVHRRIGGPLLDADAASMFRYASAGTLSALMRAAGLVEVDEQSRELPWAWPGTAEELWEYAQAVSTPFRPLLARIPEDQRGAIDREVHAALRSYQGSGRLNFEAVVTLAAASKP